MRALDPGALYGDQSGRLFLAVSPSKVVTRWGEGEKARWIETKRGLAWRRETDVSTERLCWSWGVTVDELDEMSRKYFSAPEPPKDASPSYKGEIKRRGRSGPIVYRVRAADLR